VAVPNVLGHVPALTQSSYRAAVASVIRSVQLVHNESDQDVGDRVGCSAATIGNARNEKGDLNPVTLLRIGKEYGLHVLGPVMLLIAAKAAPIEAVCTSDREMPIHVAGAQLFLSRALADNQRIDNHEVVANAEAIEAGGQVFDSLRFRLHRLRLDGRT
jgi:hypothetical protein